MMALIYVDWSHPRWPLQLSRRRVLGKYGP